MRADSVSVRTILFLFATTAAAAARQPAASMTVEDIRTCSLENLVDRGSIRNLQVTTTGRDGKRQSLRAKLFWKPTADGRPRVNVHVVEPAELAGSSVLLLPAGSGSDVEFVYLPDVAESATAGTSFDHHQALEELREMLGNATSRRGPDTRIAGRSAFVIETRRPRIISYVDRATCVPLKSEIFSERGELEKVFEADVGSLVSVEPRWLALRFTLSDLRAGTRTIISLGEIYLKEPLPESVFAPESFHEDVE